MTHYTNMPMHILNIMRNGRKKQEIIKVNGKEISNGETFGNGENYIEIDGGIGNIDIKKIINSSGKPFSVSISVSTINYSLIIIINLV